MWTLGHRLMLVVVTTAVLLAGAAVPAAAQQWASHAAKFVCGAANVPPPPQLAKGFFKTVVNIHNPHYLVQPGGPPVPLVFFKKVVLSRPQGLDPLLPSCKIMEELPADHSLYMGCREIKALLALSGLPTMTPIEGFVVLEVPPQPFQDDPAPELDVVAVYAGAPSGGTLTTMDVERVPAVPIIGVPADDPCPDF